MTAGEPLTALPENEGVDAAVAAARRVVEALLCTGGSSAAEMTRVADGLNRIAGHLEEHALGREERLVDMWRGEGITRHDPVTGPQNAVAPPLHLRGLEDGSVVGTVTLGMAYQGPPGCVHGGVSALLLDHALGVANDWGSGPSGMTGTLALRYHRTTPLFRELTVTARQVSFSGRKITTTGEISVDGEVCVSADGLFIDAFVGRPRDE